MSCTRQSANGCVAPATSRSPFSRVSAIIWRRRSYRSVAASFTFAQTPVPTSMTDWCISAFTFSCIRRLPSWTISVAMCERRSNVTGSTVWYSSSIPMVKEGFFHQ
jgi:hypothetical protein